MIGYGQAEYLFTFAERNGHYGILKELKRIGLVNVISLLGQYQRRRIWNYMLNNKPIEAIKLLKTLPDESGHGGTHELSNQQTHN